MKSRAPMLYWGGRCDNLDLAGVLRSQHSKRIEVIALDYQIVLKAAAAAQLYIVLQRDEVVGERTCSDSEEVGTLAICLRAHLRRASGPTSPLMRPPGLLGISSQSSKLRFRRNLRRSAFA